MAIFEFNRFFIKEIDIWDNLIKWEFLFLKKLLTKISQIGLIKILQTCLMINSQHWKKQFLNVFLNHISKIILMNKLKMPFRF